MPTNLTVLRQWTMLRLVPRAPAKVAVKDLQQQLRDADFRVSARTIQRDLIELSTLFPLISDDREKPYGWSWQRDASSFDLPGLSIPDALTLTLVEQHLCNQLPPTALDALQPQFRSASRVLGAMDETVTSKAWLNKIRTIAPLQPLQPPALNEDCQRTVYTALMKDLQLTLRYKKRDAKEATLYPAVHPLAIVQRGGIIYLVCTFAGHDDVRTLALHRVQEAGLVYEEAKRDPGFDVDAFIASGAFGFLTGPPIVLRATFQRAVAEHLFETPLAPDQLLEPCPDGSVHVTATVASTRTLVYWLTGFGAAVQVHSPATLRAELKDTALRMAANYS
ncbi:WYL domain-containing protein [Massilia sp. Dwa41.01b]|uniref:helix-turn-helix transcriptional regulator n=1 Tax=unclassified Massilia TaxID=2609279 RepID=UPI001603C922|nr:MULTISPECIES: WYL domain-containing protein [unclassified Massilia]QNA88870.1 WYL domain-containing protein [Massilia sp. Dwa41.01b]QNA99763.1 WYL domain-containing protein [Massilia sp. Se16.2.3]